MANIGTLIDTAVTSWDELVAHRRAVSASGSSTTAPGGKRAVVDGKNLTIAALVATARYGLTPSLDSSPAVRSRIDDSVRCLSDKLARGESLYGINTGFGGSADSRTANTVALQLALLQHQQAGVLPVPRGFPACTPSPAGSALQLSDPVATLSMPEAFVRGAMLVRLSSLMRGHSGVRWEVLQRMQALIRNRITPVVPLRGSISASGDLSPLSYVAGCLAGQPGIWAWVDGPDGKREMVPSNEALARHGIEATKYEPKEALGILNGTAFSASVAALALHDVENLCLLTQCTTAMAVEALHGMDNSFAPFIHSEARPHPGQVESAATIMSLLQGSKLANHLEDEKPTRFADDVGSLRQDRYPLRTAAQWIGPQIEDILAARASLTIEMNSTTDNPLIDVAEDRIHHGGNFQAMACTNAMEKVRQSLQHFGKLTFAQLTEIINPSMNRGLPANLAATDPSLNFHAKGIDIALASVTAELGFLANPVSTHVQSAEMANQAVNSLALISARYTIKSVECLSMLQAWSLYLLCQAFDLRAIQRQIYTVLEDQIQRSISAHFSTWIDGPNQRALATRVFVRISKRLDETSARDLRARLSDAYMAAAEELVEHFTSLPSGGGADPLRSIWAWRAASASETHDLHRKLTLQYLQDPKGCHASPLLGKTARLYEFVRRTLGVPMHGMNNFVEFKGEQGEMRETIGGYVSVIYESIRNGDLYAVMIEMLKDVQATSGASLPTSRL